MIFTSDVFIAMKQHKMQLRDTLFIPDQACVHFQVNHLSDQQAVRVQVTRWIYFPEKLFPIL
jgi:hypothetical protein